MNLSAELEAFAEEAVQSGCYRNRAELVAFGMALVARYGCAAEGGVARLRNDLSTENINPVTGERLQRMATA